MNWKSTRQHFETALIWVSVGALAFVIWEIREAILLAFGAILTAILLRLFADWISSWTRLSESISLGVATFAIIALIGFTIWLFGSDLSSQFSQLMQHVQGGIQQLRSLMKQTGGGNFGSNFTQQGTSMIAGLITGFASAGLRAVEAAVVLAISAIYVPAQPKHSRHGLVRQFRPELRARARKTIDLIGRTLQLWLLGQLLLMLEVAVLSFFAVWWIGLPNPIALALLAGLAEAIPYLGPFISAIPAVLVALTVGIEAAVWTIGAYIFIHLIEGYLTAPLIERYFVTIPPALILGGLVAVDLLFGTVGLIVAAPMTVAIYIAVKMAYVEDPLGENK
jgi:predicted PurR-regulated permease PerM